MTDFTDKVAEAKKKGFVTIYSDTDERVEKSIEAYNREMGDSRVMRRNVKNIEMGFVTVNPLLVICIFAGTADELKASIFLAVILFAVFVIGFAGFGLLKPNYPIATAFVAPLLILDIRYGILLLADILLAVWHTVSNGKLKRRQGYPAFADIRMTYDRNPAPKD